MEDNFLLPADDELAEFYQRNVSNRNYPFPSY